MLSLAMISLQVCGAQFTAAWHSHISFAAAFLRSTFAVTAGTILTVRGLRMSWPGPSLGGDPYLAPGCTQSDIDRWYGDYEPADPEPDYDPEDEPEDPDNFDENGDRIE